MRTIENEKDVYELCLSEDEIGYILGLAKGNYGEFFPDHTMKAQAIMRHMEEWFKQHAHFNFGGI